MAMKMENISNGKVIGIGEVTILPGEVKEIPAAYEASPILEVYKKMGFARITGKVSAPAKTQEEVEAEKRLRLKRLRQMRRSCGKHVWHPWRESARRAWHPWQMSLESIRRSARTRPMY